MVSTKSEVAILEKWRVALENAKKQPKIAGFMEEFGYGTEMLDQGQALLIQTRNAFDQNKTEDDETSEAYSIFKRKKKVLFDGYKMHRKKARIIFKNDLLTQEKLGVLGTYPRVYIQRMETAKKFYTIVSSDAAILPRLLRLKITAEDIASCLTLVGEVEAARAKYLREVGESQDATKTKDKAISDMQDWMSEFYAVAGIALEDHPQLLEVLGKIVKS
jgi:hypothetical protein